MSVELHAAVVWDCDECGIENFARAIEGNIDEAALKEYAEDVVGLLATNDAIEVDDMEMATECLAQVIAVYPKHVTCRNCSRTFETEIFTTEEE